MQPVLCFSYNANGGQKGLISRCSGLHMRSWFYQYVCTLQVIGGSCKSYRWPLGDGSIVNLIEQYTVLARRPQSLMCNAHVLHVVAHTSSCNLWVKDPPCNGQKISPNGFRFIGIPLYTVQAEHYCWSRWSETRSPKTCNSFYAKGLCSYRL